ncbi:pimeloyl-ACP methyl ester carboxylesterase [Nakamurella sp. UYEF19]|uniref:alpha/beta fold hydrolase n=1 Tax=Nakamurella sp. UYEF19 TaxID=1756392 RepID=UPI003396298E
MSTWGRIIGAAGITTGVLGAAALGGVTAQRRAVRRYRASSGSDPQGYDMLAADRTYSVLGDDGVVLHVEEVGPDDAPLTVIFGHGWTLRAGSWHYQRIGVAGKGFGLGKSNDEARLVFFDQRSHGKSSRAGSDHVTMEDLAGDLAAVMATAAPVGPVVLVGHSMGGMALITLAGLRPNLFTDRVVGVALVSTSAGEASTRSLSRSLILSGGALIKLASATASRYPTLLERGRAGGRDAIWLLTRALGFAQKDVPGELVDYLDEMISATPVDVIADFAPALVGLDQVAALPVLGSLPVVIICGDADRQTPLSRSRAIAAALPDAELVIIEGAGHMAIMESPEIVNSTLRGLFHRALMFSRSPARKSG